MWYKKWQWNSQNPVYREHIWYIKQYFTNIEKTDVAFVLHTWIISTETQHNVSIVRYGNGVLLRWQIVLSVQQTSAIQIQSVFQIDFLHVGVRWPTNADNVERVSVQMEGMAQIGLLYYVRTVTKAIILFV